MTGQGTTGASTSRGRRDASAYEGATKPRSRTPLSKLIGQARVELETLTGRRVESVSAVHRSEEGWSMTFEVLELERVPTSTSVLGTYAVQVDGQGAVLDFERTGRYYRNQASQEDG